MNSQDDKQISEPLLATFTEDDPTHEQPSQASRIRTYGWTFSELSSLIYGYSNNPGILDLQALRPYWMKSINPELAVLRVHESLPGNNFHANRKLMVYEKGSMDKLFDNLWKRVARRGNCILFVLKILILVSSFITPCVLDLLTNNLKITDYDQKVSIPLLGDGFTQQDASFIYSIVLVLNMIAGLFIHTQYSFQNNKLRYEGRTILQYIMYRKQMDSRPKDLTNAEGEKEEEADINNLMLSDSDTVMMMFTNFHDCWFAIVSLAITLFLLFFKLRSALPIGLGMVLLLLFVVSRLTKKMVAIHPERMKVQDKRIGLTSNIVEGIKSIKYLCWESIFHGKLLDLRAKEFAYVSKLKYLDCYSVVIWGTASISIITFTFIAYSLAGYDLSDANIFTDIAFFQMLIFPLNQLPWSIGFVGNGFISLKRIKTFLTREDAPESKNEEAEVVSGDYAVTLKTKALTWTKVNENKEGEKLFALRNLDLCVKPFTLNMIIGNIGSGKTALLSAILGELRFLEIPEDAEEIRIFKTENKIVTNGNIAYVPQNPWLQKKSVRENILFGKEFDPVYYKKCLEACDLLVDINTFKNGDKYDVGLNGANLSGGQRQRISLCRALYQDADIYLLDDILSAVDVGVGTILLQKAVLGLLKERRKTVIFVLSQYKYLKHADKVYLMRNGNLYEDKNSINDFVNAAKIHSKEDNNDCSTTQISSSLNPESSIQLGANIINTEERPQISQENLEKIEEQEEEENREQGEIKAKTMMAFINAMGKWTFIFILVGGALMQISKAWFDFWLRDYLAAHAKKQNPWFYLGSFETTILVLMFVSIICSAYRAWIFAYGNLLSAKVIFSKLVPKVLYAKMPFFDENPVGRIIQRFSGDAWSLDYQFAFNWNILLNEVNTFFRILFVFVTQLPIILTVITPATGIFYVIQKKYRKVNREVKRIDSVYSGRFLTQLAETTSGVAIIRSFKKENYMVKDFLDRIRDNLLSRSIMETMCQWFAIRLSSLTIVISSSVLILSLYYKYYLGASTNYSDFALILLYALTSPLNFESMICWVAESEKELIGIERINQYLDNETEEKIERPKKAVQVAPSHREGEIAITIDKESEKNLAELDQVMEDPNRTAVIGFKSVYLKYQKAGKDSYALKDINFSVKRGEKVALCGRTGSGKTTILNSLLKFYEVHKGEIKFYDEDIENLCKQDLRSHIAVIPQFGFMYEATLKENLDPYGIIPKENLMKVLEMGKEFMRKAAEKKHKEEEEKEEIELVKEGQEEEEKNQSDRIFDEGFIIEKGGSNLSNGEKQIINFMRVLLRDSNVVFLDEATSNVDPVTDELMHQALFEMCQNKTLIVITHRLDYLKFYDRVILLEGGEIVDEGSYEELVMKQNGKFKEFLHSGQ